MNDLLLLLSDLSPTSDGSQDTKPSDDVKVAGLFRSQLLIAGPNSSCFFDIIFILFGFELTVVSLGLALGPLEFFIRLVET